LAAAEALGAIRDTRAIKPLIEALRDERQEVRQAAARALATIGTPALMALINTLQNSVASGFLWEVWGAREAGVAAAEALGMIRDAWAVEPLIEAAIRKGHTEVSEAAVKALAAIGEPAVLPLIRLVRQRKDRRPFDWLFGEWWVAAEALKAIGEPAVMALTKLLQDEREEVRQVAAEVLQEIRGF
jgi:HEAT repeat protein